MKLPARPLTLVVLIALMFAGVGTTTAIRSSGADESDSATIERVVDGDTLVVMVDGQSQRIRMIGVDTPETVAPNKPVDCFGREASDYTKSLLSKGTEVRLVYDVERTDRYGRILAYVHRSSDDKSINDELVRNGYANTLTIPPNVARARELSRLAAEAREQRRGLWGACN